MARYSIVYIDKRLILGGNKTRGDVYFETQYPSETNSVHVLNQLEFRQKIGDFDKSGTNSFERLPPKQIDRLQIFPCQIYFRR